VVRGGAKSCVPQDTTLVRHLAAAAPHRSAPKRCLKLTRTHPDCCCQPAVSLRADPRSTRLTQAGKPAAAAGAAGVTLEYTILAN
jgi:hypothetical protein